MDKETALKEHYKLWDWLMRNPGKEKDDYPLFKEGLKIENDCFMCEYTCSLGLTYGVKCDKCLIDFGSGNCETNCEDFPSPYMKWAGLTYRFSSHNMCKGTKRFVLINLAREIRNLPLREVEEDAEI